MGESPEHVFNTGSPAIDGLDDFEAMTDEELIELGFTKPFAILLQHPAGLDDATECKNFKATIKALGKMSYLPILPNRDPGYQGIADAMTELKIDLPEPLPRPLFISMLKRAVVLVGNSSAGIIEAAAVNPKAGGVPVVNIGHRQNGRQKPSNVIDCDYGFKSVSKAIKQAIKNPPNVVSIRMAMAQRANKLPNCLPRSISSNCLWANKTAIKAFYVISCLSANEPRP